MNIPCDGYILMIETSQRNGSVALGTFDGQLKDEELFGPGLVHGKELLPRIDTIVSRNQAKSQLAVIAVSVGPGSFTGIRIGVSAAKALAWSLKLPLLGISSLDVMAANIEQDGEWGVLLDARSGDLDLAMFEVNDKKALRLDQDQAIHKDDFYSRVDPETGFIGSGSRAADFPAGLKTGPEEWDIPRAGRGLELANSLVRQIAEGHPAPAGWDQPHLLNPRYLRVSRAEEVRRRRIEGEEQA